MAAGWRWRGLFAALGRARQGPDAPGDVEALLDENGVTDPEARGHYVRWLPVERRQGSYFASILLDHLPGEVDAAIRRERLSLIDVGCSCGHLVARLRQRYRSSRVEGVELEGFRVAVARRYYPECVFRQQDVTRLGETYGCVFSSNVLEHFAAPLDVLRGVLAPLATHFVVSLVPWREQERIEGHLATFDEASFPPELDGFRRTHLEVIDCAAGHADCWPGSQALVVYRRVR